MKTPPLSLYVHLPWCVQKCPYCDFNSHTAGDAAPKQRYIDALLADLDHESKRAGPRTLKSIFLGGGTPSLFTPQEIGRLLDGVSSRFSIADDAEITMEANPGTVECGAPAGYRGAGVNRLSIGAQSFDDKMLRVLGRIHSSDDVVRSVSEARKAGFDNINIDLMHGLPGQNIEMAMADLTAAIQLGPTHVSWYQLTLEPNTVYYAHPPADLPNDDLAFEIQDRGQDLLSNEGYDQYEVSAYARDSHQCRHNLNYWQFGDYLAVGAGAHGKLTRDGDVYRYQKPANPLGYMKSLDKAFDKTLDNSACSDALKPLSARDLLFEFVLNAVRLNGGFPERLFCERTGLSADTLGRAAGRAVERGLLKREAGGQWCPTSLGGRFLNDLQSEFLGVEA